MSKRQSLLQITGDKTVTKKTEKKVLPRKRQELAAIMARATVIFISWIVLIVDLASAINRSKLILLLVIIDPWKMERGIWPMFMGELVGTTSLIFIGCMGCIGTMGSSPPPPMQTALTFGLTVNLLIMTYGHISGAHFNPAVTLGALMLGMKSIPTSIIYVIAQFLGAILGYGLIKVVTPAALMNDGNPNSAAPLCVTVIHPDVSIVQAILIEILCTSLILLGACATWDSRCSHTTDSTAIRFGMAVAAISFAASPYTGCSMNPARTFGPALWNSAWENQWVYWVGPMVGGALGTSSYIVLFGKKESSKKNGYESYKMNEVNAPELDNPISLECAQ